MTTKEIQAIDLMLEDLHTSHHQIRTTARELDCEKELEQLKNNIIEYLYDVKSFHTS